MKRPWKTLGWGIGLIVVGVFFTLFSLGALQAYQDETVVVLSLVLAIAGLGFLAAAIVRRGSWWLVVPGFFLLGTAAVVYLGGSGQGDSRQQAAALFGAMGLGHLLLFVTNRRQRWWAWLIGGTFFVLAVLLLAGISGNHPLFGVALLLGLSAVFLLYYLVMPPTEPRWWTLVLGVVSAVGAGFVMTVSAPQAGPVVRFWPVALLLIGLVLAIWAIARWTAAAPAEGGPYVPPAETSQPVASGGVTPVPESVPVSGSSPKGVSQPTQPTTEAAEEGSRRPDEEKAGPEEMRSEETPPEPPASKRDELG